MNNRKLVRALRKTIEAQGCEIVGITVRKHYRFEIEHAGRRHKVTAATSPTDFTACVNSVRQLVRRTIAAGA